MRIPTRSLLLALLDREPTGGWYPVGDAQPQRVLRLRDLG